MSSIVDGLRNALTRLEVSFKRQKDVLDKTVSQIEAIRAMIEKETGQPGLPMSGGTKR